MSVVNAEMSMNLSCAIYCIRANIIINQEASKSFIKLAACDCICTMTQSED